MSGTRGVLAVVLIALVFTAIWLLSRSTEVPNQAASPSLAVSVDEPLKPELVRHAGSGGIGAPATQRPADRYLVTMGDPFLEPRSEAEVEWLRRNKYPNAAAREDAARFASELDFDHRDGVEAVEIIAAEQFAHQHPDNRSRAVQFLNEAAISGSTYALETLARLSESPADPVTSEAYYRASALRGDWNARLRVKPDLTREQEMLADLLAHQVIDNLQRQRRQRGLPELNTDLRPGLDWFLQQVKEAERAMAAAGRQ